MLSAISPIDGRYGSKTKSLQNYFSEYALIRYRVYVEIEYFKALVELELPQLRDIDPQMMIYLDNIVNNFSHSDAEKVKNIEKTTNHDVKAVEYFIKSHFERLGLEKYMEFIHFGLTSQDVNNTAFPLMIKEANEHILFPQLMSLIINLETLCEEYKGIPMLAHTHGQPASPTTLGKELEVFAERLRTQTDQLTSLSYKAKFGGATGNLNAHKITFPDVDWIKFSNSFVHSLGLVRLQKTTQIEHYDQIAAMCHNYIRINSILIDLCRDIWTYISMEYFKQKVVKDEVGSSAMPHKVNPIDFENAEGNLGLANALFEHLAAKLPVSRLQRDLTDSTVLRNIGVPFAHTLIALHSVEKGLSKLQLNKVKLEEDLNKNWAVVAEAIQNILRREQYPKPYEALKELTRGKANITESDIKTFIQNLEIGDHVKEELLRISPHNYVGYY